MKIYSLLETWLTDGAVIALSDGRVLLGYGEKTYHTHKPSFSQKEAPPCFYVSDFFLKSKSPWVSYKETCSFTKEELLHELFPLRESSIQLRQWSNPYAKVFKENFEELQLKFSCNELIKAVPYVFDIANCLTDQNALKEMLIRVLSYSLTHPVHVYGYWDKDEGVLGATPEILFRQTVDRRLETMACAGTSSKEVSIEHFMKDPKQLEEHGVVVNSIVNSLSFYGKVSIGNLQVLQLPNLNHLITPISLKCQEYLQIDDLIRILHPTPALGAFPATPGNKWLELYAKKVPRRRFGAPFGVCLKNQIDMYVAIRNVQWTKDKMFIGAGAGVVKSSSYCEESAEIQLKLKAIKEILGL